MATTVTHGPNTSVWSSDLQRARSTAEIIAERLGAGPVNVDGRLRETDVGPWQGLTSPEIEEGWPGYIAAGRRPDGFEPEADLLDRVLPALLDIARAAPAGGVPIVVAHAGVLRAVRRHSGAVDEHLANLAGLWFAVDPASGARPLHRSLGDAAGSLRRSWEPRSVSGSGRTASSSTSSKRRSSGAASSRGAS